MGIGCRKRAADEGVVCVGWWDIDVLRTGKRQLRIYCQCHLYIEKVLINPILPGF